MAQNMQAILDWIAVNRPDLVPQLEKMLSAEFQDANPTTPLGPLV